MVVWVDSPRALILDLGNSVFGFCPLGLVYDDKKDAIGKEYKIGSHHACRLVQFNRLDGFAIVSLQPSVLNRPYMKFADLKVGEAVEGKVERHGDYGMTVSLTDTIRGMVPRLHLADVDLKNPKARFKEGGAVKCRVLSLEPEKRRLLLTCKRSLVQSDKERLCDYSQAKPGEVYQGVIAAVREIGCVVRFFGDVVGRVHKLELSSIQLVTDPKAVFSVGQTVECRVLECKPASRELKVSFRLDRGDPLAAVDGLDVSVVMDLEVMGVTSGGINLRAPSGELAFLPTPHLSDYPSLCAPLLKIHQAGLEKATREGTASPIPLVVTASPIPLIMTASPIPLVMTASPIPLVMTASPIPLVMTASPSPCHDSLPHPFLVMTASPSLSCHDSLPHPFLVMTASPIPPRHVDCTLVCTPSHSNIRH